MNHDRRTPKGPDTAHGPDEWSLVADVPLGDIMGKEEFLSYAPPRGGTDDPGDPSAEEIAWHVRASVLSALAETHRHSQKAVAAAVRRIGSAAAEVRSASAKFALAGRRVTSAELASKTVRGLPPPPAGLGYDPYSRSVGRFGYVAILVICGLAEILLARATLQAVGSALGLGTALIVALAVTPAIALTLAAHLVGKLLRRQSEAVGSKLLYERLKIQALLALMAMVTLALPLLRASSEGHVISAVLTAATTGALVVSALTASYLHSSSRLDAFDTTDDQLLRAGRAAASYGREFLKAQAHYISSINAMQAVAASVVARVDLVYARWHVEPHTYGEPTWVLQLRDWANGVNLPFRLELPPADGRVELDQYTLDHDDNGGERALDAPEVAQSA